MSSPLHNCFPCSAEITAITFHRAPIPPVLPIEIIILLYKVSRLIILTQKSDHVLFASNRLVTSTFRLRSYLLDAIHSLIFWLVHVFSIQLAINYYTCTSLEQIFFFRVFFICLWHYFHYPNPIQIYANLSRSGRAHTISVFFFVIFFILIKYM